MVMNLDGDQAKLEVTTSNPRSHFCSDFFLIANTETWHVENFLGMFPGKHSFTFKLSGQSAISDMQNRGM